MKKLDALILFKYLKNQNLLIYVRMSWKLWKIIRYIMKDKFLKLIIRDKA